MKGTRKYHVNAFGIVVRETTNTPLLTIKALFSMYFDFDSMITHKIKQQKANNIKNEQ